MPDRTYSEREIADLIERAVERQQEARRAQAGETLTLGEIERLAAEAGIDPQFLREAADEMDAAGRTLRKESGTTKTTVFVERWIDAELTPEAWEDAVVELRERFGPAMGAALGGVAGGTVQQVGNAYEWRHTSGLGVQTTVTASPRDGRTRLRLTQLVGLASPTAEGVAYGGGIALVLAPLLMVAIKAATGASLGFWPAALAFLVLWAVAAPTTTALDRRWRAKKHTALGALADDLVPVLGAARPTSARTGTAAEPPATEQASPLPSGGPALDLDALPEAPDATPDRTPRRERE